MHAEVTFACAVENASPYIDQALRLLASIRWFGGAQSRARFVVGALEPFSKEVEEEFHKLGAVITPLIRFDKRHGPSNKIALLGLDQLRDAERIVLLDCDTLVVQDPSPWLDVNGIAAKPADLPTVSLDQLRDLHDAFGLPFPDPIHENDVSQTATIHYVNSGVLVINGKWRERLFRAWSDFGSRLIENHGSPQITPYFSDQAALALAITATEIPFDALPTAMNMPVHLDAGHYPDRFWDIDPVVIHYHWLSDWAGYVLPTPFHRVNLRIDAFNACLRASRSDTKTSALKNKVTDLARSPKVILATGWWAGERPHDWSIGADAAAHPAFFDIWYRRVMECINPTRIIVTDSASTAVPDWKSYQNVSWITLDRNYGHANDIRTGRIATKYSGFTRSVINGAMFALCCDADLFVYLEQDCLVRGKNLINEAIGGRDGDIFLGTPTLGGRGLNGTPAASMLQQSLMIVKKSGLERFISGILGAPWTDGEVPPEETMRQRLQPISELAIPYGRSRPIDFNRSHFYVQHLTQDELQTMMEIEG